MYIQTINLITHTPLKQIVKSKTGNKEFLFLFISTELHSY